MRVMVNHNPFPTMPMPGYSQEAVACVARWVWHPLAQSGQAQVMAFRLVFDVTTAQTLRLHASADQRYELFLDGRRLGRGPERGDLAHWAYETYDEAVTVGPHLLAARVWWLPGEGAPMAQMSGLPGLLVLAEGALAAIVSTGSGAWQVAAIEAYTQEPAQVAGYYVVGWSFRMEGIRFPWGWQTDPAAPGDWVLAQATQVPIGGGSNPYYDADDHPRHVGQKHLRPAALPPMLEEPRLVGTVRHAAATLNTAAPVRAAEHDAALAAGWQALLRGEAPLRLEPGARVRVIVDLDNYYCAYPEFVASGGAGAELTLGWAESLFTEGHPGALIKGNRDVVEAKYFHGPADRFILEGGQGRAYDTLWWRAGRYVQITVAVGADPLTIERLAWRETRYPLEMEGRFTASDPRLGAILPIMLRGLQMCAHETYMDCPYYEQLMYVGDTRLEALVTYVTSGQCRLPKVANTLFDWSRAADGLTKSRYPSALHQVIPPFALWWVSMVHDYALWRNDLDSVRGWLPGVDAVLTGFSRYLAPEGLVGPMPGWSFCDWVPEWTAGWPPGARDGVSCLINLMFVYALERAAELHTWFGEPEMGDHWRRLSRRVRQGVIATFWDEPRGLLADDAAHTHFSEHAQVLALLTDLLAGPRRQRLAQGLLEAPDLARTTIYFSHYLFEAFRLLGRADRLYERLDLWMALQSQGFKTTFEEPEPSRSDCHAWGAHPIYHYYATLLGARPAAPAFGAIRIAPQPGPLTWLRGEMPHPNGLIGFALAFEQGQARGRVTLPDGLAGTFVWGAVEQPLHPGENEIG